MLTSKKCLHLFILSVFTIVILNGCSNNHLKKEPVIPEYVFTYAENQAADYPSTQGAYKFAELVKKYTNGRIEIQVEPNAVLGNEKEIVEQLQFGGIDFTRASISIISDDIPQLNVLCMPYLYKNAQHKWAVLDGEIGQEFLDIFKEKNLIGLSWYDAGARNFYTIDKPIKSLEDISDMKIRVQDSSLTNDMIRILGGIPVNVEFKDVYSALETGAIDGAENNWPSYDSTEHYRIAQYYTVDEHICIPEVQLCSLPTWERLTSEDQKIIQKCAYESALYERKLWVQQEKQSMEKLKDSGVTVNQLTDEELLRFQNAVKPLYEQYCLEYMDLVTEIKNYSN